MDIQFLLWFQQFRTPFLDGLFQFITLFGEQTLLVAVLCLIYWCLNKRLAQYMLFNFFVGGVFNQLLKVGFAVARPWVRSVELRPVASAMKGASGFSFPSGHTASATAVYGSMAIYFRRRWIGWACVSLILLVGLSRLYLGVHAPQDVLVSWVLGAVLLFVTRRLFEAIERHPGWDAWVMAAGLGISAGLMLFASRRQLPEGGAELALDSFKVAGAAVGLFVGWFLERRWVRFETQATPLRQVLKYALGMALVLLVMLVPWPFSLMRDRMAALIRYALLSLSALALWPLAFTRACP